MATTPVLLPGKFHGWRSIVCYSPWGCKESDTTEQLHFTSLHFTWSINLIHQIFSSKGKIHTIFVDAVSMFDKSQYPLFLIVVKYTQHKIYHFNHFFQNSMVLAQKQTHRSMEQDRKPRNKPMHLAFFQTTIKRIKLVN